MKNLDELKLRSIATARSGDKGNHANIGVIAKNRAAYAFLDEHLTAACVSEYFGGLAATGVERFALPQVWAFNFVLYNALGGGASRSLRIDSQGKLLGTALLEMQFLVPAEIASRLTDVS